MAHLVNIARSGNDFSCSVDSGPTFFVGRRVPYEGNIGLYNIFSASKIEKLNFSSADFSAAHGFWAMFIEPTISCEGRNFLTLNTYDSAAFTFGCGQFAAHVPDGDFIQFFHTLLAMPEGKLYFPNLEIVAGRIHRVGESTPLESATSTKPLMQYLNPDLEEIQDAEVVAAAKLIHWTSKSPAARDAQVAVMLKTFKGFMLQADARVGLDGRAAAQCCVIADILHHGRGGKMAWPLIDAALKSARPYEALVAIGAPRWNERKKTLKKAIDSKADFKKKVWNRSNQDFA